MFKMCLKLLFPFNTILVSLATTEFKNSLIVFFLNNSKSDLNRRKSVYYRINTVIIVVRS